MSARTRKEKCNRKDPRVYEAIDIGYTVYEDGKVYNKIKKVYMSFSKSKTSGYMNVSLRYELDGVKKRSHFTQHELVCRKFVPNPDGHPVINHIDGDKTNNTISNLEWTTYSKNTKHAHDNLEYKKANKTILQCDVDDNTIVINSFHTVEVIKEQTSIKGARVHVRKICREGGGIYEGFYWRFENPEHSQFGFDEQHNTEEWRELPNPKGGKSMYIFSNMGRGFSFYVNKYLSTKPIKGIDYVYISIYGKREYIHVIIADLFIPIPEELKGLSLVVNHINGIKHDNRVENLEWTTQSNNMKHANRVLPSVSSKPIIQYDAEGNEIGRYANSNEACEKLKYKKEINKTIRYACNDPTTKHLICGSYWRSEDNPLTKEELQTMRAKYRRVRQYDMNCNFIKEYLSIEDASRKTKMSGGDIGHMCKNRRCPKDFIWRYAEDDPPYVGDDGKLVLGEKVSSKKSICKNSRPVNQYTVEGVFVKRWERATDARIHYKMKNLSGIYSVCRTAAGLEKKCPRYTAGGFKWEYAG